MSGPTTEQDRARYWRKNLSWLGALLTVWFIVSYGCGILFVDQLDKFKLGGVPLGFWFAQQGSIYVFVMLIAVYVLVMNRLDKELLGEKFK
jgi:putative solute:sodium symporter small subunit